MSRYFRLRFHSAGTIRIMAIGTQGTEVMPWVSCLRKGNQLASKIRFKKNSARFQNNSLITSVLIQDTTLVINGRIKTK